MLQLKGFFRIVSAVTIQKNMCIYCDIQSLSGIPYAALLVPPMVAISYITSHYRLLCVTDAYHATITATFEVLSRL